MGVERSVTRWYLCRQLILDEIEQLQVKLAAPPAKAIAVELEDDTHVDIVPVDPEAMALQLKVAREKLKALGHCPKPMMG